MTDIPAPSYRILTTDLLSNKVIAEIPFTGSKYTLGLSAAGEFSGDVYVNSETVKLGLYEATKPGKTGLYVLRDDKCVWGGIIWAREYNVNDRTLGVSASEFTSYFHHRKIWKTFTTSFGGTLTVPPDATADSVITLDMGTPFQLPKGSTVLVMFSDDTMYNLTGYFETTQDSDGNNIAINPKNRYYRATKKRVTALESDSSIATVKITTAKSHGLSIGDDVSLTNTGIERLDGTRTVSSVNGSTTFTIKVPSSDTTAGLKAVDTADVSLNSKAQVTVNGSVPPGGPYVVTVDIKPDTYTFIKGLIDSTMSDFTTVGFPNVSIETGNTEVFDISSYKVSGNIATLTTTDPHGLGPGQKITLRNVTSSLNKTFEVLETIDDVTITVAVSSNPIPYTETGVKRSMITKKYTRNLETTYTFSADHSFSKGDYVSINNVPSQVEHYTQNGKSKSRGWAYNDNSVMVIGVPATNQIVVETNVKYSDAAVIDYSTYRKNPNGYALSFPSLVVGTYGPYPYNSDIGITFEESDADLLGLHTESKIVRGFELNTIADVLDAYAVTANGGDGFDYRVECRFDPEINQFTRVFRFVPAFPGNAVIADNDAVISQLGADQIIFEYPGNISTFSIKESAEDAATRMFVVGDQSELQGEASQPYSAAALTDYLAAGWPLLDGNEAYKGLGGADEAVLYTVADMYLMESTPPIMDFSLSINGSLSPLVGTYAPGDWCSILVDDDYVRMRLESDDEPRNDVLLRKILKIEVSIPDAATIPEEVSVELLSKRQLIGTQRAGGARTNAFSTISR